MRHETRDMINVNDYQPLEVLVEKNALICAIWSIRFFFLSISFAPMSEPKWSEPVVHELRSSKTLNQLVNCERSMFPITRIRLQKLNVNTLHYCSALCTLKSNMYAMFENGKQGTAQKEKRKLIFQSLFCFFATILDSWLIQTCCVIERRMYGNMKF